VYLFSLGPIVNPLTIWVLASLFLLLL